MYIYIHIYIFIYIHFTTVKAPIKTTTINSIGAATTGQGGQHSM